VDEVVGLYRDDRSSVPAVPGLRPDPAAGSRVQRAETCGLETNLNRDFAFQLAVSLGFQPALF
jgi:hypothetical protein